MDTLFTLRVRIAACVMLVVAACLLLPTVTFADGTPDLPIGGSDGTILTVTAPILTMIVAFVIPIINGLLTRLTTSSWVKGLLTLILNGVYSIIATATQADGTAVFGEQMLFTWILGFGISVASYVGIYKGAGLTSSTTKVNGTPVPGKLSNIGLK